MLLKATLTPYMVIVFLRLVLPLLSDTVYQKTGVQLFNYYSIAVISIICVIPMLFGIVYAFRLLDENDVHILNVISVTPFGMRSFLYLRMIPPSFLSFVVVYLTILLTNPVPEEGWLRTIYISVLMALQAPFVFLFITSLAGNKTKGLKFVKLYWFFLAAVPAGLLLHHPWNYLAFFSPLYWISWAWVTEIPGESLIYGAISFSIAAGCMLLFFFHFLKKHPG
jgi:fluoroquinolone transport system permease protein